jgi:enoyl-CoA hydratase
MTDIVLDQPHEGVKRITLNRPDHLNAFTYGMYWQLIEILSSLRHDSKTRVVILTGAGRGFCAGHDLRAGGQADWLDDPSMSRPYMGRHVMMEMSSIPLLMRQLSQPVICAVNGAAAGAGFAFALAADLCIAAKSAKFVNSIHNAGTGHEFGMSYLLPRAIGTQRAAEILLTARPVLADEAERIGLVLRAVPDEELQNAAIELAKAIIVNVPIGVWITKQSLWFNQGIGSLEAAMELEARGVMISQSTADAAEKRQSFLEKRTPRFQNK